MTIVFAGFDIRSESDLLPDEFVEDFGGNSTNPVEKIEKIDGVYFAADSAITNNNKTLLNGFRKIYPINVVLWKPYISGDTFRDYSDKYYSFEVALAFAGSTLSAQHYMNSINEHLGNLRVTLKDVYGEISFKIVMNGEENHLEKRPIKFSRDVFADKNFTNLLTAEYISSVFLHSLRHAVSSAREHKIGPEDFPTLKVDVALAVQCQDSSEYHLYQYQMNDVLVDNMLQIEIAQVELGKDDVAVLGLRNKYGSLARAEQMKITEANDCRPKKMLDYLNSCIDAENISGNIGVARPSVLNIYKNGKLDLVR